MEWLHRTTGTWMEAAGGRRQQHRNREVPE